MCPAVLSTHSCLLGPTSVFCLGEREERRPPSKPEAWCLCSSARREPSVAHGHKLAAKRQKGQAITEINCKRPERGWLTTADHSGHRPASFCMKAPPLCGDWKLLAQRQTLGRRHQGRVTRTGRRRKRREEEAAEGEGARSMMAVDGSGGVGGILMGAA